MTTVDDTVSPLPGGVRPFKGHVSSLKQARDPTLGHENGTMNFSHASSLLYTSERISCSNCKYIIKVYYGIDFKRKNVLTPLSRYSHGMSICIFTNMNCKFNRVRFIFSF